MPSLTLGPRAHVFERPHDEPALLPPALAAPADAHARLHAVRVHLQQRRVRRPERRRGQRAVGLDLVEACMRMEGRSKSGECNTESRCSCDCKVKIIASRSEAILFAKTDKDLSSARIFSKREDPDSFILGIPVLLLHKFLILYSIVLTT